MCIIILYGMCAVHSIYIPRDVFRLAGVEQGFSLHLFVLSNLEGNAPVYPSEALPILTSLNTNILHRSSIPILHQVKMNPSREAHR